MNSTAKKQNRLLLVTLLVVLTAAAILIAVTGSANKKSEDETEPPIETVETDPIKKADPKATDDKPQLKDPADSTTDPALKSMDPEKAGDKTESKSEKESETTQETAPAKEAAAMSETALPRFSAPVNGMVLKDYSDNIPVFSYTMDDYRVHRGMDFACSPGTPVYASADGVICEVKHDPMMGVTVGIQHAGGALTRYMGLSEESLYLTQTGQNIKVGQVIGASGETALIESAEEGHMHFELLIDGEHKDPGDYMKVVHLSDVMEG